MRRLVPRSLPFAIALTLVPLLSPNAASGQAADAATRSAPVAIDIPAQPLGDALNAWARQTGARIAVRQTLLAGRTAPAVSGRMTAREALDRLLAGSGLVARVDGDDVVIGQAPPPGETSLPPVTVVGRSERGAATEGTGAYATPASTVGKTAEPLRDTPQSVTVLTRARLDDQNLVELTDAVKAVPGVIVRRQSSVGGRSDILSRGYQAGTYQLDGSTASVNPATVDSLDLALFDRVEALRGPAGLFSGAGEPGVMINLARKRALASRQIDGAIGIGSRDRRRIEVDATGGLDGGGRVRGRLVALAEGYGSELKGVDGEKQALYGTVEFDPTPRTTWSVGATWQQSRGNYDTGLPAYADGRLANVPRDTAIVADWTRARPMSLVGFAESETRLDGGGVFKLSVRHLSREQRDRYINAYSAISATGTSRFTQAQDVARDYADTSADVYLSKPFRWFGQTHNVIVGADYRTADTDTVLASGAMATTVDLGNYDPRAIPEPPFETYWKTAGKTDSYGAYTQLRIKPTQALTLVGGARQSWWKTRTTDLLAGTRTGYQADGEITPFGAVLYDLTGALTAYASYAEIFQPQSGLTAGGGQIEPRVGNQVEVGLKGSFLDGRLETSAAVFRLTDRNRALADPNNPAFVIAAGKVEAEGFETEVVGALTSRWQLAAGYAYNTTEYVRGTATQTGQPFSPFTPRHSVNLWTRYRLPERIAGGLEVGGGVRAVSDFSTTLGAVRWRTGGYSVWSLYAAYRIDRRLKLALNVDNLFDRTYWERIENGTRSNYYGAPRSVMLTLRGSW
ncbi:MAG: TonB-dependent siderophore receptor [Lautropia sp.]